MSKKELSSNLESVTKIATASKFMRMLNNPYKYFNAILFRELIYKNSKKGKEIKASTFFDAQMDLLLPASTDIYLTGGKSHDSEIRLAKFFINHLDKEDQFVDVGAHYGYFSLLAATLIGQSGKVLSFEASPTTYVYLDKNCTKYENINSYNLAVSDSNAHITFYEFPNLYSEYNSLDVKQFKNEEWFSKHPPKEVKVDTIMLDNLLTDKNIHPKLIKIDVEGAEFKVISGLKNYLVDHAPTIVLEYLSDKRGNEEHVKAEKLLKSLGFKSYIIDPSGDLLHVESIASYINAEDLESDNIVFRKEALLN